MSNLRSRRAAKRSRRATYIHVDQPGVLDMHRRWYGAVIATLLAGGLVLSGLSPATADETAPPTTVPVSDEAVAEPTTEPTPEVTEESQPPAELSEPAPPASQAPEPTVEPAPPVASPTPPAVEPTAEPSEPAPAPSLPSAPTVPASPVATAAPEPVSTVEAVEPRIGIQAFSQLNECFNFTCGSLRVDVQVSGGTANASMWEVRATDTATTDYYVLPDDQWYDVNRNNPSSYQISWTSTNPAATGYTAALTCSTGGSSNQGTRVTFNQATSTVTFYGTGYPGNGNRYSSDCDLVLTAPVVPVSTTITTYVAGDRTGLSGLTGLPGATLKLWTGDSSGPSAVINQPWATCISDAAGTCVFTVPEANTTYAGQRFWVVQDDAPVGWNINEFIATGSSGGTLTKYAARTAAMSATPQDSRVDFMIGTGNTTDAASGGTFVMSRDNVPVPVACGVDAALLFDLSGSLSGQLPAIKDAGNAMVSALEGTNSSIGVYTFANAAPATAGGNYAKTAVSTTAGANALRTHINGFTTPVGATNWDRGLSQINPADYDVVIVITDGNPTRYGNEEGPGSYTRFREVENGALSANMLKAGGARVIAIGVGDGINGPANNLIAISGDDTGDYYQAADFTAAANAVKQLALGDCLGTLTVVKQMVPQGNTGENVTGATPAGGWTFEASSQTANLAVTVGSGVTAADTGAVNFPLVFSNGLSSGNVRVNEVSQSGFSIVTQSGKNAVCTATRLDGTTSSVTVTNQTVNGNPGFDVPVPHDASVSCVVYNKPALVQTSITVDKVWSINGVEYTDLTNPLAPEGVNATLQLDATNQNWGTPRGNITEGTVVAISESVATMPSTLAQCVYGGTEILNAAGDVVSATATYNAELDADASANRYTIKNSVTCGSQLTLIKNVANGDADPGDWTLTAYGPDSALDGPSGPTTVTGPVTPGTRYELGESGPAEYLQTVAPGAVINAPSTGTWACVQLNAQGNVVPGFADGLNGGVVVPLGYHVRCTAINETAWLVLQKSVINDNGGTADASAFILTATPAPWPGLATPNDVLGSLVTSSDNTIQVRPDHVYTLTEGQLNGYAFVKLQQLVGSTWVDVVAASDPAAYPQQDSDGNWMVTVSPRATDTYRFVNDDVAPTIRLVKSVVDAWGSTGDPADWTLSAQSEEDGGITGTTGVSSTVVAGVGYDLSESGGPAGWTQTGLSCTSGLVGTTVTALVGDDITCTFTNTAEPAHLQLIKEVDNTGVTGGAEPADWNGELWADQGGTQVSFDTGETIDVNAGTYTIGENDVVDGYAMSDLVCTGNDSAATVSTGQRDVTIGHGETVVCTITNKAAESTITLVKSVEYPNGGAAEASEWTLSALTEAGTGSVSGTTGVTGVAQAGVEYTLSESGLTGYELTSLVCDGLQNVSTTSPTFTLSPGQSTTCTFTNSSLPGGLKLTKAVDNTNGGDAVPSDWNQQLVATPAGGSDLAFDSGETKQVAAGDYALAETDGPLGYQLTGITCGGVAVDLADPQVTVTNGETVECVFTNASIAPQITLIKVVDDVEWGGTAVNTDWTLSATAGASDPTVSGETGVSGPIKAGVEYTLAESAIDGYTLTSLACTGQNTTVDQPTLTLEPGTSTTCTFTNTSLPGELKITKVVDNANGGSAVASDWNQKLHATIGDDQLTFDSGETLSVANGTYLIGEDAGEPGYELTGIACDDVALDLSNPTVMVPNGELVECVVTNASIAPVVTLVKVVDTSMWGGSADPASWMLSATAGDDQPEVVGRTGTDEATGPVTAGVAYTLAETEGTAGFALTDLSCTNDVVVSDDHAITLEPGQTTTCTFTNSSLPGSLQLVKSVDLTNGGDAVPADWNQSLQAQLGDGDPIAFDHEETKQLAAGTYTLSELQSVEGYTWTDLSCVGQNTSMSEPTVTVSNGQTAVCTFENASIAPHLTLVKVTESPYGEPVDASAWTLSATTAGGPNVSGTTPASGDVKALTEYVLTEDDAVTGYELTSLVCTGHDEVELDEPYITLAEGENVTCTFTNTEQPGQLLMFKWVDNTNGGSAVDSDWNQLLEATLGDETLRFDSGEQREVAPGTYTLTEGVGPAGYELTSLSCGDEFNNSAASLADPTVTVKPGDVWECWFHNTSQKPKLTLEKELDNTGGGRASADDWTLTATAGDGAFINGTGTLISDNVAAISGDAVAEVGIDLGEMGPSGYTAGDWACADTATGDEVSFMEGQLWLAIGDDVTCRIVNTAIPATGTVDKQLTSYAQNADGTWTIDYEITVSNQSADSALSYSLTDTLQYGAGIDVLSATWSGNGQTDQAFAADGTATLATDAVIEPPYGTEVYTVTVNADVTAAAYNNETTYCDPDGSVAGGFLNTAWLDDGQDGGESRACAEPITPTVDKGTENVEDNGDGTYTLSYLLTVEAPFAAEGQSVYYDLTDELNLPEGVTLVGTATAAGLGTTPAPTNPTFDGSGIWTIVSGGTVGSEPHVYLVTVTLQTSAAAVGGEPVCSNEGSGIAVGNTGTVTSGSYVASDDVCDTVHYDDVSLVKTAGLGEDETSVEPGDTFDYVLTVTNNGSRTATDVLVTDTSINDRLTVLGIAVSDGVTWAPVGGYDDNDVALTIDEIAVGESVTITVTVMFEMPAVTPIGTGALMPTPVALNEFTNEACVAMDGDQNADNDCDDVTTPVRDIAAVVTAVCVGDAPFLNWSVTKSETLRDEEVTLVWTPNASGTHVPADVTMTEPGGELTWSGQVAWPGSAFTPSGVSIDYPGWRELVASDFAPDGGYYVPGTMTVMTAEEQAMWVFNGLILDPSELDYAWRLESTVTISVNPSVSFTAVYPEALPECAVARHSDVQVEKTASVEKAMPGDNISYTIAVGNLSDDSAAEGVVVTDEIPDTLKVTAVTWPGQGDDTVFPNWEACDITDTSADGYGGTLTCTLFGPLQPVGVGTSDAPTLTLTATVAKTAPAGEVTNVAIVDYHTFGDPDDSGRDADDAVVTIGAAGGSTPPKPTLPATGGPINGTWVILGLLGVLGGTLVIIRRRRGEVRARL